MIGIITYDAPHRKTQDIIAKLLLHGYSDIHLAVIPWVTRKNFLPIFKHRPSKRISIPVEELCANTGIQYTKVEIPDLAGFFADKQFGHIMIGGAGLLPESLPLQFKIINSHPGYLPNMRGLDAFKWAIYQGQPIGVTTHYISDKADEGELIDKREVPLYYEDTFHSLAYRVYETEIEMLVEAIRLIEDKKAPLTDLSEGDYTANRRMPHHYEVIMMDRFEQMRRQAASHRDM